MAKFNSPLDGPPLLRFRYHDGFTQRLLSIDLTIHQEGTYRGSMSFYPASGAEMKTISLEGVAPRRLLESLEELLNSEDRLRTLEKIYDSYLEDVDEQEYILPLQTIRVRGFTKKAENALQMPTEKKFITFRRLLQQWLAEKI